MIKTPESSILYASIAQVRPAVTTAQTQQADLSVIISEKHEIFTKETDTERRVWLKLHGKGNRLPIETHQVTHGRPRTRLR
jgi:hypothetical protein